jgi:dihydroflavonol-4-reductase
MNIAVTGASGHIGMNLCRALTAQGHSVRVLIHHNDRVLHQSGLERTDGDVLDRDSLYTLLRDIEVVFHLAAVISIHVRSQSELFAKNVQGTRNLMHAARESGVRRVIHFSSIHALDPKPLDKILDENRPLAICDRLAYSRSKALAEEAVLKAAAAGQDVVILNPTAVLGPYDCSPSLMGKALIAMYSGKLPALIQGGYDWVDVRDVVDASLTAIPRGHSGTRYLLSGHWRTVRELASMMKDLGGHPPPRLTLPVGLARWGLPFLRFHCRLTGTEPLYTRDSLHILQHSPRHVSRGRAVRDLDYSPRPLDETLKDTLAWFHDHGFLGET